MTLLISPAFSLPGALPQADHVQEGAKRRIRPPVVGLCRLPRMVKQGVELGIAQVAHLAVDGHLRVIVEAPTLVGMPVVKLVPSSCGGDVNSAANSKPSRPSRMAW